MFGERLEKEVEAVILKAPKGISEIALIIAVMEVDPMGLFSILWIREALKTLVEKGHVYKGKSNRYYSGHERSW